MRAREESSQHSSFAQLELQDQAKAWEEVRNAGAKPSGGRPLSAREIRRRVEAQRVLRLAQQMTAPAPGSEISVPQGNYAALFEADGKDVRASEPRDGSDAEPLDELNSLIGEMIAAAQGEDQVRGWAPRLSRILEELRQAAAPVKITQQRLWRDGKGGGTGSRKLTSPGTQDIISTK